MAVVLRKEPEIWQHWINDRDQDMFLSVDVRRLIGILYSVQSPTPQLVAGATKLSVDHVFVLARALKASTDFIVKEALTNGLSLEAAVDLPHGGLPVKCKLCRQFLTAVPCQKCLVQKTRRTQIVSVTVDELEDRPTPPEPTTHRPGSYEKMMKMQERFLAGYSIFHPSDFEVAINPIPHNMRSTSLRRDQYLNDSNRRSDTNGSRPLRGLLSRNGDEARGAVVQRSRVVV